jgi:hypothetical protein
MHNSEDDSYVVGIRRKGELQFELGFLPNDESTHDNATGLIAAWSSGQKDFYDLVFPDGAHWYFSGFVTNIAPSAPVDDGLTASVSIRPSGGHIITPNT